jgi:hypothetical protein
MTRKDKQTSQPLPPAKTLDKRSAALRGNLAKRRRQAQARERTEEKT